MMLKRTALPGPTVDDKPKSGDSQDIGAALSYAMGLVRRHWIAVAACVVASTGLAIAYLLVTPPIYRGASYLMLDTKKMQVFNQASAVVGDTPYLDPAAIDSQLEVLKSDAIARSVVEDMKLADDPEATGRLRGFFGTLVASIRDLVARHDLDGPEGAVATHSREDLTERAVGFVRGNLDVKRVRYTYIIKIGFHSRDPAKAARIANAIADAYILDQSQSRQFTTKRAIAWLKERVEELKNQAIEADRAVQNFKTENRLISAGSGRLDEQQLGDLVSQLTAARAQTAEAKARLDQVQEVIASDSTNSILSDALKNDVISRLRQQYVEVSRRERDLAARLGPEHAAVVNARREMQQIRRAALDELKRAEQAYKGEYAVAQSREAAIQANLNASTSVDASARQALGPLAMLESSAQSLRALHNSFVQRYAEATQQQHFTDTDARIITPAAGGGKVSPKTQQILGGALVFGLFAGLGFAFLREQLDRVFRTPKQLEDALGVECLGVLPAVPAKQKPPKAQANGLADDDTKREIVADLGVARQVILTPFSRFSETIRAVKVAADTSTSARDVRVIGLVSAVPSEGKTTVASNLAQLMSHSGGRTLLIDCDFRNPSLSRIMAPRSKSGLLDLIQGRCSVAEAVWRDPITGLHFVSAHVNGSGIEHSSEWLSSDKMKAFITAAREQYDYVVLDFPPLGPVVDAKAAAHLVDAFVLVVKWGQTSPEVIAETLGSAEMVQSKLLGAILNRANPKALRRIESYKGYEYHNYYKPYTAS